MEPSKVTVLELEVTYLTMAACCLSDVVCAEGEAIVD
jgi:hypothetical protein